jgi:hypothetical protein
MAPHLGDPRRIRHRTQRHRAQTPYRDPTKLFRTVQDHRSHMQGQLEDRDEGILNAGERGTVGGDGHGLRELLGGEVEDPETEARDGEEEEEGECEEGTGGG